MSLDFSRLGFEKQVGVSKFVLSENTSSGKSTSFSGTEAADTSAAASAGVVVTAAVVVVVGGTAVVDVVVVGGSVVTTAAAGGSGTAAATVGGSGIAAAGGARTKSVPSTSFRRSAGCSVSAGGWAVVVLLASKTGFSWKKAKLLTLRRETVLR